MGLSLHRSLFHLGPNCLSLFHIIIVIIVVAATGINGLKDGKATATTTQQHHFWLSKFSKLTCEVLVKYVPTRVRKASLGVGEYANHLAH